MFLKKVIFWSFGRGTIPYDILCALILAFIFLTPTAFFRDWPRVDAPQQFQTGRGVIPTRDHLGNLVYNVQLPMELRAADPPALNRNVQMFLEKQLHKPLHITRIQPIYGGKGDIVGFSVWAEKRAEANP